MSENIDELEAALALEEAIERKQNELRQKKLEIDHRRTTLAHDKMVRDEEDLKKAQSFDFGHVSNEQIDNLIAESEQYIEAAKVKMEFINRTFDNVVPFFRKNLILVGAKTGSGKSTCVANIVRGLLRQKRPDGSPRRVLVLTNEERAEDFYNRITCLIKGWHYTNHDKFTDDQKAEFSKYIALLGRNQLLNVVDDSYGGITGNTTSIEGIRAIFDNLLATGQHYDAIIIDYYQNIKYSKLDPMLDEYKVQATFANMMDGYKNRMPCPLVVMAQVNPETENDKKPFEHRIKGRKVITDPSTLIMELIAEPGDRRTLWKVHKSRFTQAIGQEFYTGYKDGAYVEYDAEFIKNVTALKELRHQAEMDKLSGHQMKKKVEKKDEKVQEKADSGKSDPANG